MSLDFLELGSVPTNEPCKQVGTDDYYDIQRECLRFRDYLRQLFPIPLELIEFNRFYVKTFNHDFGRYCEVVIAFDHMNDASVSFAFHVESNLPETWPRDIPLDYSKSG